MYVGSPLCHKLNGSVVLSQKRVQSGSRLEKKDPRRHQPRRYLSDATQAAQGVTSVLHAGNDNAMALVLGVQDVTSVGSGVL